MTTLHRILIVILFTIAFASHGCSGSEDGNGPEAGAWTVLVYMAADNNLPYDLGPAALRDMNEMEEVGSTDLVNVIVQVDLHEGTEWETCRRYRIESDSDPLMVTSPVLDDLGEQDMTDPDTLEDFLRWGKSTYPAARYLVVLWGHGDAWQDEQQVQVMAIFDDDDPVREKLTPNFLVRQAMEGAGMRADILAFDACDMGILEAAYEFGGRADFMVASQELVWQDGYPYDDILAAVVSDPEIAPEELARTMVQLYGSYYTSMYPFSRYEQCLSALDLSRANAVANQVEVLAQDLRAEIDDVDFLDALQDVREVSEDFVTPLEPRHRFVDLLHLAEGLEAEPGLGLNTDPLESAISVMVVENFQRSGSGGHPNASGLSIYFPLDKDDYEDDPSYSGAVSPSAFLDFHWDEFLEEYFENMP